MDNFAQIAKNGIQGRHELLHTPEPSALPDRTFELEPCKAQPTPLAAHMHTREELQAALEEKRRWAEPFLRDLAPSLKSCRTFRSFWILNGKNPTTNSGLR